MILDHKSCTIAVTEKKVGIVILNWNGWKDTVCCVLSLSSLSYKNYFVIIIDNASSDNSVEEIEKALPHVKIVVNDRNRGFGGGCNPGIRAALDMKADFVWLLNNDTVVRKETLTAMAEEIESENLVGAVGSVLYYMDNPDKVQAWGGGYVNSLLGVSKHLYEKPQRKSKLHYLTGASLLIRSEVLNSVGFFDEKFFMYWEDVDLGFRIRQNNWKICVAEKSILLHKESASLGRKSPLLTRYLNQSAIIFFRKHFIFWQWPVFIGIFGRLVKKILQRDWSGFNAILSVLLRR
ncbi:glycosyltransferase family 2 protein [Nevskia ramosa]|uniref:glycosyltransferase family 2 protein n=1 Tax=Nevskia ramosa TaxID=64002 RepID=UPI003D13B14D